MPYNIEFLKQDAFQQIMHDSKARNEAVTHTISEIERLSGRVFIEADKAKLQDFLAWLPLEDGSSLFMSSGAPADKEEVGSVELATEHATIYFGENRVHNSWPYAMGVHFTNKTKNETLFYTEEGFKAQFPLLAEDVLIAVKPEMEYMIIVYPKAGDLYRAVTSDKNREGEWLIQTPTALGKFVPNRGIGFIEAKSNIIHVFDPSIKHKRNVRYSRYCAFYV